VRVVGANHRAKADADEKEGRGLTDGPWVPTGGGEGLSSEINVTPLIDVLLVLLIIFM